MIPPPYPKKFRIALIDDHPMTRDGIMRWIESVPDMEVCWETDSAEAGLTASIECPPDVVVADISLRGKSGIEFIKDLQSSQPSVAVLVLTMHDESLYAERALKAGARGYIMKHEGGAKLIATIRSVLEGKIQVSEQISGRILEAYSRPASSDQAGVCGLTDREFEIFKLLGSGIPTKVIGKRLHLSHKTVDSHRANIKKKLKISKISELIAFAANWIAGEVHSRG